MDSAEIELQFLRRVFVKFDTDNTDKLTENEFTNLISALSSHVTDISVDPTVVKAVFAYYDSDVDKLLSFQDVYRWWISPLRFEFFKGEKARLITKAMQTFNTYSKENNGKLSFTEFETLLEDLYFYHSDTIFDEIDVDGDGLVSFTEFADWLGWFS